MGDMRKWTRDERIAYVAGTAEGSRQKQAEIVEECCRLAVVGKLPRYHVDTEMGWYDGYRRDVPIAPAPPSLAGDVALELLHRVSAQREALGTQPPPFAAAYSDTPTGRVYVLRSGDCGSDVGAIARRYGGDGDAREATFEVRR